MICFFGSKPRSRIALRGSPAGSAARGARPDELALADRDAARARPALDLVGRRARARSRSKSHTFMLTCAQLQVVEEEAHGLDARAGRRPSRGSSWRSPWRRRRPCVSRFTLKAIRNDARADHDRAGGRVERVLRARVGRRARDRLPIASRSSSKPTVAHVGQVPALGTQRGGLVEVDRDLELAPDALAERVRESRRTPPSSLPSSGTNGTTSVAPMRGCSPWCCVRSIRSRAPARSRGTRPRRRPRAAPTNVTTARLWLASRLWSMSLHARRPSAIAARIASTTSGPAAFAEVGNALDEAHGASIGPARARGRQGAATAGVALERRRGRALTTARTGLRPSS